MRLVPGLAALLVGTVSIQAQDPQIEFFEKRIRPVLSERCYECHSATAKKLKGGLRLDSRQRLLSGGDTGPAFDPAHPDESLLLVAIRYTDQDLQMPPKAKLTEQEIADLTTWITGGAPWPDEPEPVDASRKEFDLAQRRQTHWAWRPIGSPSLPAVHETKWPLRPTDRFLLAELEANDLRPAGAADPRTLVRRLYFDLTGLPPSPSEVEQFAAAPSADAYQRLVDELLASPHFGERWGRHWLDLVRYAETMGHEFDYNIANAWRYRDYVIRAFNADVPYNQFVREHIAGDLLPEPRRHPTLGFNESVIGTGFFWLGQQTHSPVNVRLHQAEVIDNQIDVLSKAFLGLTVACARCHDHKFDAISTKDFYSLYGTVSSSRYTQAAIDDETQIQPRVRQLLDLKTRLKRALSDHQLAGAATVGDYLLAANEVLHGRVDSPAAAHQDIVFEDFEGSTYAGWTVEGTAFGESPQTQRSIAQYQGDVGAVGKGFVNSHDIRSSGSPGDRPTGTLTSAPFKIERSFIHFLLGGGGHANRTCVHLLVDGTVARTRAGANANRMKPSRFDVNDLLGRTAQIQIVDQESGGWGNIGIDHIVFSDRGSFFGDDNQPLAPRPDAEAVAGRLGLDPAALRRWVHTIEESKSPADPFYAWARMTASPQAASPAGFLERWRELVQTRNASADQTAANPTFLGDFTQGEFGAWMVEGPAFGEAPVAPGTLVVTDDTDKPISYLENAAADSRVLARRLQGVLRSPTFTVTNRYLHFRVAGRNCRLNIVVDNFVVIRDPIYGRLKHRIDHQDFRWISVDVERWIGDRAYVELSDRSVGDPSEGSYDPEGWLAVSHVVASSASSPPSVPSAPSLDWSEAQPESLTDLAQQYTGRAQHAAGAIQKDQPVAAAERALVTWIGSIQPASPMAVELAREYADAARNIPEPTRVPGMADGTGVDEAVFVRGNPNTLGPLVPRRFLEALGGTTPFQHGSGRLELARQLTDPANPFLSRVMANRVWSHLFGTGIVPTPDDFGVLGTPPSHPELLDWLANYFRTEANWSVKALVRLLVTSRAYQMSSRPTDATAEDKDPTNSLLHRMRVRRLEGEAIRDAILAVSGRLDRKLFGPSVPVYLTEFMEGRGRPGSSGPADGAGRRSIYVEVRRNFLSPMMLAFDTPTPFTTIGRRTSSNVPAQALILMNDPFVAEQARLWARRVLATASSDARQRIKAIYLSALSRPPLDEELADALEFLRSQASTYRDDAGGEPDDEQLWADFCHVILNLKEFVFLN